MKRLIAMTALAAGLATVAPAHASDTGYIHGRVVTESGDTYQGELRWGDEEAFWEDMFNATKTRNDFVQYLNDDQLERLRRDHRGLWERIFEHRDDDFEHVFEIRFGDLKRIDVDGRNRIEATFRNGKTIALGGGSNDVGARITVVDADGGTRRIGWNRIRSIEFTPAPEHIAHKLGLPLYGTVRTHRFEFTGCIQWDNDECLSIDKLDGDDRDGDVSIPFSDIASIRKRGRGVRVRLLDGSEMDLTGSNDVNGENRGVVVKVKEIGSVRIGWNDFEEVTFQHPAPVSGRGYEEFGEGAPLTGVVVARDGRHRGRIVFDLDEAWDFEMLDGRNGDTRYLIPFRRIERITPRGSHRTIVGLRGGIDIELEDSQDVTRQNDGVLIFDGDSRPAYVEWEDIREIRFDRS